MIEKQSLVYDRRELLSYLRIKGEPDAATATLIDRATREIYDAIAITLLFRVFRMKDGVSSKTVAARCTGCDRVAAFTVSIGAECDRVVRRAGAVSAAYGTVADAVASAFAEAAAEAVEKELMRRYPQGLRPRISPGYGDFPLTAQADIFRALACEKQGIRLLPSMLTLPMKTVTAVIGIEKGMNYE